MKYLGKISNNKDLITKEYSDAKIICHNFEEIEDSSGILLNTTYTYNVESILDIFWEIITHVANGFYDNSHITGIVTLRTNIIDSNNNIIDKVSFISTLFEQVDSYTYKIEFTGELYRLNVTYFFDSSDPSRSALTSVDVIATKANYEEVFIAEYGTTTYAQVTQALADGKIVFAHCYKTGEIDVEYYLPLTYSDRGSSYVFTGIFEAGSIKYILRSSGWEDYSMNLAMTDTITSWYGTCSTTSSTVQKAVSCPGYEENRGNILGVLFTTANTAATPTLSINGGTAKSIYVGNSAPNSTTNVLKWSANTYPDIAI